MRLFLFFPPILALYLWLSVQASAMPLAEAAEHHVKTDTEFEPKRDKHPIDKLSFGLPARFIA